MADVKPFTPLSSALDTTRELLWGDELKAWILNHCEYQLDVKDDPARWIYNTWPDAIKDLADLWTGWASSANVMYDLRVTKGNKYVGSRMLIWNDKGETHSLKAVLLDVGYGFDTTATVVSPNAKNGYLTMKPHPDRQPINWRVIDKRHDEAAADKDDEPEAMTKGSRFEWLLRALADPRYQDPMPEDESASAALALAAASTAPPPKHPHPRGGKLAAKLPPKRPPKKAPPKKRAGSPARVVFVPPKKRKALPPDADAALDALLEAAAPTGAPPLALPGGETEEVAVVFKLPLSARGAKRDSASPYRGVQADRGGVFSTRYLEWTYPGAHKMRGEEEANLKRFRSRDPRELAILTAVFQRNYALANAAEARVVEDDALASPVPLLAAPAAAPAAPAAALAASGSSFDDDGVEEEEIVVEEEGEPVWPWMQTLAESEAIYDAYREKYLAQFAKLSTSNPTAARHFLDGHKAWIKRMSELCAGAAGALWAWGREVAGGGS